ncbi:site-2 protease family protein [Haloplanus rubicundus]|uniref:Site-2 protease family protein n=1 Tax=Haloplanus rubicundus TaxID=1547898 RepID=A0A345E8Z4_9EURY|nr:site-2 protease family protein [Haloplanus rubicundus]AXG08666.1 site-2 protease family protein [Haloplanus rubicundus]
MDEPTVSGDLPDPESLTDAFLVYEVEAAEEGVRYYGELTEAREAVLRTLAPAFRERGYRVTLTREMGEYVLVATERSTGVDGVPWTHVALFGATLVTTLYAGSQWYGIDLRADPLAVVGAWPFALSVLGVLAVHELGHYVLSRHHEVEASLPYFIPIPSVLGTLGAVIRMNDTIPSRRALFDIGVAGPLAGLGATVVVTAVGVSLPPVASGSTLVADLQLGYPLLVQGIAALLGEPLSYGAGRTVNPVVVGGWVGAFVTFLNLLPVGQLDGAHVTRALVGERLDSIQRVIPLALFGLAGYLVVVEGGRGAQIWAFWGVLTLLFSRAGSATPMDETPVGPKRRVVGALTLVLGVLCFTPVPIAFAG